MTERKRKRGLSARFVETVKPETRTKLYCDDNGLYLAVQPSGSRQWVQRLVIRERRRELGLGGFPLVSLAEAREAAFHNRNSPDRVAIRWLISASPRCLPSRKRRGL